MFYNLSNIDIFTDIYTAGKINIQQVINFLIQHIYKCAADMKFSPDVDKNSSNLLMQGNQTIDVHQFSHV